MTNPFILAIRADAKKFLGDLEVTELRAVAEGCVDVLEARAKAGETAAPGVLQALYRKLANVKV